MDREQILLNEREEGRQSAMDETLVLRDCYEGKPYIFEYGGQTMTAEFVTACLQTAEQPASGYRIELLASPQTLVDGECMITDSRGRKIDAFAITIRGDAQNLIVLETVAQASRTNRLTNARDSQPHFKQSKRRVIL
jgi:hypothetical protein